MTCHTLQIGTKMQFPGNTRQLRLNTILFALAALAIPSACTAQTPAAVHHNWKTYTNVRLQYSVCYPDDLLVPQGEAENSDGQTFLAKDGAKLVVFGRNNALNQSLKEAFEDTASRLSGSSGKVTYKLVKPSWFVVSGENGQNVFYAKMLAADQMFKSFEITYDSKLSTTYSPVVSRLASCFVTS